MVTCRARVVVVLTFFTLLFIPAAHAAVPLSSPLYQNPWEPQERSFWDPALTAYYAGDLEGALELLTQLLSTLPHQEISVRSNRAAVFMELGRPADAAREYSALRELEPENPRHALAEAWANLAAGNLKQARDLFSAYLDRHDPHPWAYLGQAQVFEEMGLLPQAIEALKSAVELDEVFAPAWERLGLLYGRGEYFDDAATALRRALQLDSSYSHLNLELARAYRAVGRIGDAWDYYERSSRIFSSDAGVQQEVARFVEEHESAVVAIERARDDLRRRQSHITPRPGPPLSGISVRVGLAERATSLMISAGSYFEVRDDTGEVLDELSPGIWEIRGALGGIQMIHDVRGVVQFDKDHLHLVLDDSGRTWIAMGLDAGRGYFWSRVEDVQVRGDLRILNRPAGLTLVNQLDLEEYLLAVVPSEMYASMPLEALKAQAISARTYTLRNLGRYADRGFDVMGSVFSSAYRGVGSENERTSQAVLETRGQVLRSGTSLAESYYHSSAGGYTASSEEVWGGRRTYLQAVGEWQGEGPEFPLAPSTLGNWLRTTPDVFSHGTGYGGATTLRWVRRVSVETIASRLAASAQIGQIVAVVPGVRSVGGWVRNVVIYGTEGKVEVSGDIVRSRLGGLKSSAFTVMPLLGEDGLPHSFLFFGAGFGHGVGLSQIGAAGMAQAGASALEILGHYFPGAEVAQHYGLTPSK